MREEAEVLQGVRGLSRRKLRAWVQAGWVLPARVGSDGVREWRPFAVKLDADGVPHPAFDKPSPCGRAGDADIRECQGMP